MNHGKRKPQRILCLILACCCLLPMLPRQSARAATQSELEAEQERLAQEKSELEDKLASLREDEASKKEYQQVLQEKIRVVEQQIDDARLEIADLNNRITVLSLKLEKSQDKIQSTIDQFKERLKSIYKAGDVGTLEILLDSHSFSDFTMRSELVRSMTAHDQELMDRIEAYKLDTQAEREELEADKRRVAQLQKQLEAQQKELAGLYEENEQALAQILAAEGETEDAISANEAQQAENEAMIQKLIEEERERQRQAAIAAAAAANNPGSPVVIPTGEGVEGFHPIWPLPGVTYISAGFNGYPGHKGLDIAGPYGTPVVAAESGTVIAANNYDSWGDSWGYYVLIYHNGTYTTRYAHLSSLAVSSGEYVTAGTIVGYEGATGNVTGPHLHFEVYQNGTRVDPLLFL